MNLQIGFLAFALAPSATTAGDAGGRIHGSVCFMLAHPILDDPAVQLLDTAQLPTVKKQNVEIDIRPMMVFLIF